MDPRSRDPLARMHGSRHELASQVFEVQLARQPEINETYSAAWRRAALDDIAHTLEHLYYTAMYEAPGLFKRYVAWLRVVLESRGVPRSHLAVNLECIEAVLRETIDTSGLEPVMESLRAGIEVFDESFQDETREPIVDSSGDSPSSRYLSLLLAGRRDDASALVSGLVSNGVDVRDAYLGVLQPVQHEIGRLWQRNEICVAQEHYCTAVTQSIIARLYARVFTSERKGHHLVATSVGGELHELGIRMVADFFEMDGWDTYYLGASTPVESIVPAIQCYAADLLAVSTTMIAHLPLVDKIVERVRDESPGVHVLVGGYPFNASPGLWRKVGADAFAADAKAAVEMGNALVRGGKP